MTPAGSTGVERDCAGLASPVLQGHRSDVLFEEALSLRLARRSAIHAFFSFREGVRVPSRVLHHLHLHEPPGVRRDLERGGATLKQRLLARRGEWSFGRTCRSADVVTFSSHWAAEQCRHLFGPEVEQAVAPLAGFCDDTAERPVPLLAERDGVLMAATADSRDSIEWATSVLARAFAGWPDDEAPGVSAYGRGGSAVSSARRLGFLPTDELVQCYERSRVYVHSSSFEGFGLPLIEAMQRGTPVVAPSGTAVSELLAGRSSETTAAASERLRRLLLDDDYWIRESAASAELARSYSWRKCASTIAKSLDRRKIGNA